MSLISFSDGVTVDTSGKLHAKLIHNEMYVIGRGMLIPVLDSEDANRVIKLMGGPKLSEKDLRMKVCEEIDGMKREDFLDFANETLETRKAYTMDDIDWEE